MVGLQELNIYHKFNPIYWNTSVLICNSGSVDEELDSSTNYGKIGTALGQVMKRGINVALPNINKSGYTFEPDVENNRIYYGLFAISGINKDIAHYIMDNRPYSSLDDFIDKTQGVLKNTHYVTLIKAGAFDELEGSDRKAIMKKYLSRTIDKVSKIDGRHMIKMLSKKITPFTGDIQARYLNFRNYIFDSKFEIKTEYTTKNKKFYLLNNISEDFFNEHFIDHCIEGKQYFFNEDGLIVNKNSFDNVYKKIAQPIVEWAKTKDAVDLYNNMILEERINELYTSLEQMEIEALNYYYSGHLLDGCKLENHGVTDFFELNEEPEVKEKRTSKKGIEYNVYYSDRIAGTVIHKDKSKKVVYLLTPTGVVPIKYRDGAFGHYDKQISKINPDGSKTVINKSWFKRHSHLVVEGYRRDTMFYPYVSDKNRHTTMRIVEVNKDKEYPLKLEFERPRVDK